MSASCRPDDVTYADEAGGTTATCQACGWEFWNPNEATTRHRAGQHTKNGEG